MNFSDAKTAIEGVGLFRKIVEWDLTGRKAEISELREKLHEVEQRLHESEQEVSLRHVGVWGLSTQDLAVIGISAVAVIAIVAIVVVVSQRGLIQS